MRTQQLVRRSRTIGVKNLVDVRSPDEFTGKIAAPAHLPQEAGARLGHIPTAVNLPWSKTANDDGTFKSDEELRALYADAGLDPAKEVIAYCRIGERSSHSWFVLRELLGYTSAKNYDGSYLEWSNKTELPAQLADRGLTHPTTRTRRHDMRNPFQRRNKHGLGILERSMFSVMGPPQLGENKVREGYVPDAAAELCGKCHQPWADHERVHTGSMTHRRCPTSRS